MKNRNRIIKQFNRASQTYDKHCSIQNKLCNIALTKIKKYQTLFKNIVDTACGTGESTLKIIQHLNFQHCTGVDISEKLLSIAREKLKTHPNTSLILSDFNTKIFKKDSIDLIFCNMGLQWSYNLSQAIHHFHHQLTKDGTLCFTVPIDNNFPELLDSFKLNYYTHSSIKKLFNDTHWGVLETDTIQLEQPFKTHLAAIKSLKNVGANTNLKPIKQTTGLKKIDFVSFFHSNQPPRLTYHIGIYLLKKIT